MKTKEEVIREAYGVCWDQVKEFVDEDGWCSDCQIDLNNKGYNTWLEYIPADCKEMHIVYGEPECWYRPKSLQGIEDNNGWIKIESEEDLPPLMVSEKVANKRMYDACYFDDKYFILSTLNLFASGIIDGYRDKIWTHYRETTYPKPPIY